MLEINIQKIKFWLVIAIIQLGSFAMGYWIANGTTPKFKQQPLDNYTTKQSEPPKENNTHAQTSISEQCTVKGNISSKNKIYHVPGGSFYDRTTPEMCFSTEAEAEAAGFTKSSR